MPAKNSTSEKKYSYKMTYNDIEEAEFVAEKIEQLRKLEGWKYSDFSVFL